MSKPNKIFYERPQKNSSSKQINAHNETKAVKQEPVKDSTSNDIESQYFNPSYQEQDYTFTPNKGRNTVSNFKNLVTNGIIIALSAIFVLLSIVAIAEAKNMEYTWTRDEDDFWYSISEGNYMDIIEPVYHNRNQEITMTSGLQQCYAVADYLEAASLYKVAISEGDEADIKKYKAIMDESLPYLDDIMYVVEDINQKLGIE